MTNGFSQAVTHDILNRYHMDPQTPAYKAGRIIGDAGITLKGIGEVVIGGSGEIAGTCLDATGVGSVAGIPINIASAAVAADGAVSITGGVKGLLNDAVSLFEGNSSTSSANNSVQNANKGTGEVKPYSNIPDSPSVGPGKKFTKTQKNKIIQENMNKNGGVVKSDLSGKELIKPQKSQSGIKPDPDEWQIDHIDPRSKGGSNSNSNAQVLSREENRNKWDK